MDDKNKKQIVILVVMIIVLILALIGLLLYAVKNNDSGNSNSNTSLNTTNSMSINTTTMSTTTQKADVNLDENYIGTLIDDYLSDLKSTNLIGNYTIKSSNILEYNEEFEACLENGFDDKKVYVKAVIEYEALDETVVLSNNISVIDGITIADVVFVFSEEETEYNFYSLFLGC